MDIVETITVPAPVLEPGKNETDNYAAVRYNAMKHGVLPHEDKDAFHDLFFSLRLLSISQMVRLRGILWRN
jgi:hypothetical protein